MRYSPLPIDFTYVGVLNGFAKARIYSDERRKLKNFQIGVRDAILQFLRILSTRKLQFVERGSKEG